MEDILEEVVEADQEEEVVGEVLVDPHFTMFLQCVELLIQVLEVLQVIPRPLDQEDPE